MKLGDWMAMEGKDDEAVATALSQMEPDDPCSYHTVAKWRRGERTPRGRNMTKIRRLTGEAVTANDFVPDEVASAQVA